MLYHYKDRQLKKVFEPIIVDIVPNSADWLSKRRAITASSASTKAGCCESSSAQLEALWDLNHTGEQKPDPNGFMKEGHEKEDPVARNAAKIICPEQYLQGWKNDNTEVLKNKKIDPEKFYGLEETKMFLHPEHPEWISATPDREFIAHPEPRIFLEVKYSRFLLRDHPKVDHLLQCETQMECVGSDYMFITYGHLNENCSVFLIEKCPELWEWMHKRHLKYYDYVYKKKEIPPKDEIPFIANFIEDYWYKQQISGPCVNEFGKKCYVPYFFPPQPKWMLVGYKTLEKEVLDYSNCVMCHSGAGFPSDEIQRRALSHLHK